MLYNTPQPDCQLCAGRRGRTTFRKEGGGARRLEEKRYELHVLLQGNCGTAFLAHESGVALRCHAALYPVHRVVWVLAVQIKALD